MRARCRPSARAMRRSRSRWSTRRRWAAARAPLLAADVSFWAQRRPRRSSARRWACRCRTRRWLLRAADLARCGDALGTGAFCGCCSWNRVRRDVLTEASVRNAMVVHAAFGGSTNLLLHVPAIAYAAGLRAADARRVGGSEPRGAAAGGCLAERTAQVSRPCRCFSPAPCRR